MPRGLQKAPIANISELPHGEIGSNYLPEVQTGSNGLPKVQLITDQLNNLFARFAQDATLFARSFLFRVELLIVEVFLSQTGSSLPWVLQIPSTIFGINIQNPAE